MDLRYPVGRFEAPTTLTPAERLACIEALDALPARLRVAVDGLSDAQLDTPYRPEGWRVRQLVHHVADSHINAYTRFRLTLTEDEPTIRPYDQDAWAVLDDAGSMPVGVSLDLLTALHVRWVRLIRAQPDTAWARRLLHPAVGVMTLDDLLANYAWHCRHHTAHITGLRAREGW
jgi:hypothetical protein